MNDRHPLLFEVPHTHGRFLASARSSTEPELQFMGSSIIFRGTSIIVGMQYNIFFCYV